MKTLNRLCIYDAGGAEVAYVTNDNLRHLERASDWPHSGRRHLWRGRPGAGTPHDIRVGSWNGGRYSRCLHEAREGGVRPAPGLCESDPSAEVTLVSGTCSAS
jgi:hypothetical protein